MSIETLNKFPIPYCSRSLPLSSALNPYIPVFLHSFSFKLVNQHRLLTSQTYKNRNSSNVLSKAAISKFCSERGQKLEMELLSQKSISGRNFKLFCVLPDILPTLFSLQLPLVLLTTTIRINCFPPSLFVISLSLSPQKGLQFRSLLCLLSVSQLF